MKLFNCELALWLGNETSCDNFFQQMAAKHTTSSRQEAADITVYQVGAHVKVSCIFNFLIKKKFSKSFFLFNSALLFLLRFNLFIY